jgi:hypothetical protein
MNMRTQFARTPLVADRRGMAALEFAIIATVMVGLFLPLSDLAIAAIQYVGAYQGLRDLGAYAQYHAPADVTDLTAWTLPTITGYTINTTIMCGTLACSSTNTVSPQWFVFSTNIRLTPMFLTALAGTYTVVYSERFQ